LLLRAGLQARDLGRRHDAFLPGVAVFAGLLNGRYVSRSARRLKRISGALISGRHHWGAAPL
jgi:hypothetical protein